MVAIYKATTVSIEMYSQEYKTNSGPIGPSQLTDTTTTTTDLGTFDRPSTFAADETFFVPGEKIYIPHLRKYFLYEDGCVECTADQRKGLLRVDLYIGEAKRQGRALIACERAVTIMNSGGVVLNPTSEWPVVEGKVFWDGKCAYPTESYPSGAQIVHSVSSFLFAIIILI
ncbi:hypothetical protein BCR33DRAFT_850913 [Rhizoclosmatium globosum]|uniref:Uncharacterized protein n=1 Tax=Rhizoclosmatium globosum TaxID=329046 RepID=A0A1Y2C9I7_9FUNG|nr:hypothetical protein BCR33DRAFT_850913 [Rhizoclosmatium globosum]|eukprot:ORY43700.1 hypothetical protein BCR33DRAFT_850913 [Rhizoclosmatium globosum]